MRTVLLGLAATLPAIESPTCIGLVSDKKTPLVFLCKLDYFSQGLPCRSLQPAAESGIFHNFSAHGEHITTLLLIDIIIFLLPFHYCLLFNESPDFQHCLTLIYALNNQKKERAEGDLCDASLEMANETKRQGKNVCRSPCVIHSLNVSGVPDSYECIWYSFLRPPGHCTETMFAQSVYLYFPEFPNTQLSS